jgi:hypothetical protein
MSAPWGTLGRTRQLGAQPSGFFFLSVLQYHLADARRRGPLPIFLVLARAVAAKIMLLLLNRTPPLISRESPGLLPCAASKQQWRLAPHALKSLHTLATCARSATCTQMLSAGSHLP